MKIIKTAILSITLFGGSAAHALQMQCMELKSGSITDTEIRSAASFQNCFYISDTSIRSIGIISTATKGLSHRVTYSEMSPSGSLSKISEVTSDTSYGAAVTIAPNGRMIAFSFLPTTALTTNKIIGIGVLIQNGEAVVVINATNIAPTLHNPPPESCIPRPGVHCSNSLPQTPAISLQSEIQLRAQVTAAGCTGPNAPPGKPANFDINEHLIQFDDVGKLAKYMGGPSQNMTRAVTMTKAFYINRPYDLTTNPTYNHVPVNLLAPFVNYFYGMAAQKVGYDEQTAVTAGAVIQQIQNYKNSKDIGVLETMANLTFAAISGVGDNVGDPEMIRAGYNDARNCQPVTKKPTTPPASGDDSAGGPGSFGGWTGGTLSPAPGCYGSCGGSSWWDIKNPIPTQSSQ